MSKIRHFQYVPFLGLGLYGGSRGPRFLKNRIKIFKQFVVPSLQAQTNQNFTLWVSWRKEDRNNWYIDELEQHLKGIFGEDRVVFTYTGVCFYDDKYEDAIAKERMVTALHGAMNTLVNYIGDVDEVLMTLQPSDDCYHKGHVEEMQTLFKNTQYQAIGYKEGHIISYQTKEVREYNPTTNPPFFTIRFPKAVFMDTFQHMKWISLKKDVGKYKAGTPYPSHEYIGDCLPYLQLPKRGFLVGCHGENISTHFNLPFAGKAVDMDILSRYGILETPPLHISYSLRKQIMKKLPHRVQRKLRYIFGEKIYQNIYKLING